MNENQPVIRNGETERLLRAANGILCAVMMMGTVGAVIYSLVSGKMQEPWQCAAGVVAAMIVIAWGGYYASLWVKLDEAGMTFSAWVLHRRFYPWTDLQQIVLEESDDNEIASCTLTFIFSHGKKCIVSSRLFALEDVRELRDELRAAGRQLSRAEVEQ